MFQKLFVSIVTLLAAALASLTFAPFQVAASNSISFTKAQQHSGASLYAAYAYMFVYLAAEGLRNAGPDLTVESLVKGMESIKNYKSIFGATFTFSDKSHAGVTGAKLFQVKNGRWVPVEQLSSLRFPEANEVIVEELTREFGGRKRPD